MSFESKDLMVDILPARKPFAVAGVVLCGDVTAGGEDLGEDEDDDIDCGQVTANEPKTAIRTGLPLALLRRQLRQALALEQASRS